VALSYRNYGTAIGQRQFLRALIDQCAKLLSRITGWFDPK
jgi:hypothetical protein